MRQTSRRAALLGATGLLAGCESVGNWIDDLLGERKVALTGDRRPIFANDRTLEVEPGANGPANLPAPTVLAEWPLAGGTLGHAPGHPALGSGLGIAWRSSAGTGASYRRKLVAPPIVSTDTVFAMDAPGNVTALDTASGARRWQLDTRPENERDGALGGGIALDGGTLYISTGLAEMLAVNPADGTVKWRVRLPAPSRGSPTVAGGRIFVPTVENHLLALKTEDGARIWTYRAAVTPTLPLGLPAPAVEGDAVVAGFASGELAAIRASDGRPLWSETLGSARASSGGLADLSGIAAMPVIDRGRVFATGIGGITIAIDLRSGRRLWEREAGSTETPWSVGDLLLVLAIGGQLICLGRDDGRVRWIKPLGRFQDEQRRRDPITWGAPVVAGGRVIITGSNGQLVEIDPGSGEELRRLRLPAGALLQPALAGGAMYLLTEAAEVVALVGQG